MIKLIWETDISQRRDLAIGLENYEPHPRFHPVVAQFPDDRVTTPPTSHDLYSCWR